MAMLPLPTIPQVPKHYTADDKMMPSWSPYDNNGGTAVALAGEDFAIIACDTRMSTGFSILTRKSSKLLQLSDKAVVGTSGFAADIRFLFKRLKAMHVMYVQEHGRPMSCSAAAQIISRTLYYRRFFPLYTFNIVAGLDSDGKGAVYTYDAVGCLERVAFSSQGTGEALVQPLLINTVKDVNPRLLPPQALQSKMSKEEAIDLVKAAFTGTGERDIFTGDDVEIMCITKDGVEKELFALKKD